MHYKSEQGERVSPNGDHRRFGYISLMRLCKMAIVGGAPYLLFAFLSVNLCGATIQYQVTSLGEGDEYASSYFLTGMTFGLYEGVDIQFDASLYGTLSNATADPGFAFELLQPNNPPGAYGDFIAWATVADPPLTGAFTVDFTYLGPGQPGPQVFNIDQFDQNGNLVNTIASGETIPFVATVPEPATLSLYLSGLVCLVVLGSLLRRRSARDLTRNRGAAT